MDTALLVRSQRDFTWLCRRIEALPDSLLHPVS
jgi:hypothetical protein